MLALTALLCCFQGSYAQAESLLARGDLPGARHLAEQLVNHRPDDARAHLLLGRVWIRWPTIGRYNAYEEFRAAADLTPGDAEPQYWKAQVGVRLGSDEGEVIAREAILRLFAIAPDYRDSWTIFESIYHDGKIWRRADAVLARYAADPVALERRARIAIALQEYARADSLAALLLAMRGPAAPIFLLRAQAGFQLRRAAAGQAWYDSALVYADRDTTEAVWDELWMIASPDEAVRYGSLRPEERRPFFEGFWSRRDPDLITPINERLAEHYQRLADARRMFHLLHPWVRFQRSPYARALAQSYLGDDLRRLLDSAGLDGLDPATYTLPDLRPWNETADTLTVYARANVSACGLLWLRHGRPDVWETPERAAVSCTGAWTYYTGVGPLTVRFTGIPGAFGAHGDAIIAPPATRREARQVRALLTTDHTSIRAPLVARAWYATFMSERIGFTDAYTKAPPESAAVALWDATTGEIAARTTGAGVLALSVRPGAYLFGLDVDSAGVLGRARLDVRVPSYAAGVLGLSSLALAPGDSLVDRHEALATMPADLVYPAGRSLATYAEIYGLLGDPSGVAHYRIEYTFAPARSFAGRLLHGSRPVVLEFTREAPALRVVPERLVLEPGRLTPGRYRVSLAVTDLGTDVKSAPVALEITVR
jgi:hypothetical protein